MIGTPVPESLRQTVAEMAPTRPATPVPSPPPTVAPPVEPAARRRANVRDRHCRARSGRGRAARVEQPPAAECSLRHRRLR